MKKINHPAIVTLLLLILSMGSINAANTKEPPFRVILSSPPIVYGDTRDLGTFSYRKKIYNGVSFQYFGDKNVELNRIECSVPDLDCDVKIKNIRPKMIVGVSIIPRFKEPKGKFKAKVQVYWKGYDKPTVFYVTGNCIK